MSYWEYPCSKAQNVCWTIGRPKCGAQRARFKPHEIPLYTIIIWSKPLRTWNMWVKLSTIPGSIYILFITLTTFFPILVQFPLFWTDPMGSKIGINCLSHNEINLPKPMPDIVWAISKRMMMIPHPIPPTRNWLFVSCTLPLERSNPWGLVLILFADWIIRCNSLSPRQTTDIIYGCRPLCLWWFYLQIYPWSMSC